MNPVMCHCYIIVQVNIEIRNENEKKSNCVVGSGQRHSNKNCYREYIVVGEKIKFRMIYCFGMSSVAIAKQKTQ